jgi:alpha-tubulin suppressor-like RCC1 family protein
MLLGVGGGFVMHGCVAPDDGPLACWGNNDDGQSGHGDGLSFDTPTVLDAVSDLRFSVVSPARASTVALTTEGQAYVWGWNGGNRLGLGASVGNEFTPAMLLPGRRVVDISQTGFHGCLVEDGGDLSCWGSAGPELGADISGETPMLVGSSYTRVFAGIGHTCGLRGQDLFCWGDSELGEVGDGTIGEVPTPTRVEPPGVWASASLGESHTCAIRTDGTLWCWGRNEDGECGLGDVVSTPTPMQVQVPDDVAPGAGWTAVSASVTHTCAIRENRALYCWGANESSQVSGDAVPTRVPIPVIFPAE